MVTIQLESPLSDDVGGLIEALNDFLLPTSPIEFQFKMSADEMAGEDTSVFVARNQTSEAVGMGSLKIHNNKLGEVKRMYINPSIRGSGIGHKILLAIKNEAREKKLKRLVLETGSAHEFEPAWRLYERSGFCLCAGVLDYPQSDYSRFYEKKLT